MTPRIRDFFQSFFHGGDCSLTQYASTQFLHLGRREHVSVEAVCGAGRHEGRIDVVLHRPVLGGPLREQLEHLYETGTNKILRFYAMHYMMKTSYGIHYAILEFYVIHYAVKIMLHSYSLQ